MTGTPVIERTLRHCVRPADLDRIHQLLSDLWSDEVAVDGQDRIGFELAVIEVAGNIAEHSLQSPAFECDLVVRIQPDQLEAEFNDTGEPLEIDLEATEMPDEMAENGRGLAIAKMAVDELSYRRNGAVNTWRIRRKRRVPEPAPSVANARRTRATGWNAPATPGIVLVVEDDADLGGFMRAALERKVDRPVRLAENALLALQILSVEAVDVVITDIQMPGMTGLEMVSRIRQSHPALPIVMMTAHASVDYAIAALRHQVDEFLVKPISAATLVPKVKELAARGAAARQTARALANVDPSTSAEAEVMRVEREMLQDLSDAMGQRESLSQQLERAAQVQRDLLPRSAPLLAGWDLAGTCVPSFAIGGDFFDWYSTDDAVEFTVADVMGKGIPAALVTATVRAVIRGVDRSAGPAASLRSAALSLAEDLSETGTFVTMFLGRLDGTTGELRYADAGHGLSLHVRADGRFSQLVGKDLPLGIETGIESGDADTPTWAENVLTLAPGDTVVSFSDGLFDLLGGDKQAIVEVAAIVSSAADCAAIIQRVVELAGQTTLIDDVTVVAVRRDYEEIS
ncbi:serine phosphatase RsbU (regulator of sigma subunit)/anti-sigma regulatory factor (Ser/Thr protein kinase) [Nakamurella sp. UYEF19]|uniref:SpoIIE family protein phosphatase n=1 Tax=Nakamurella sp. UYEF19 TaxID=1756392 RepID=UPI003398CE67